MSVLERFHYQVAGESGKPRLVFLHGLMGSAANWRKITANFSSEFEMLIFDQRGHGRSMSAESYQPEDYASDLNKILDELGWDKIFLVGHSMGGRNALVFADLFSHRVSGLVLEDISPGADVRAVERIEYLLSLVPVPFKDKAAAKEFFAEEFPKKLKGLPSAKDLGNYFYTNIEQKEDGSADWRFHLEGIKESLWSGREKDRWDELKRLQVPCLVVRGGNSNDLPADIYQKMLESNSLIEGVVIEDAGHWVHFDQAQAFTEALREFFGKL